MSGFLVLEGANLMDGTGADPNILLLVGPLGLLINDLAAQAGHHYGDAVADFRHRRQLP